MPSGRLAQRLSKPSGRRRSGQISIRRTLLLVVVGAGTVAIIYQQFQAGGLAEADVATTSPGRLRELPGSVVRARVSSRSGAVTAAVAGKCDSLKGSVECQVYEKEEASKGGPPVPSVARFFPPPEYVGPNRFNRTRYRGVYRCDTGTGCPTYSAAFLIPTQSMLEKPVTASKMADKQTNMEAASYHLFGGRGQSAVWTSVDALDFSVEHISMYERVLKSTELAKPSLLRDAVLKSYQERLLLLERDQRIRCSEGPLARRWHRERPKRDVDLSDRVIAVMPFYAVGTGSGHSLRQTKLLYLNVTVHSIKCHFKHVAVAVSNEEDRKYVLEESGLGIYDVIFHGKELPRPSSTGLFTVKRIQELLLTKWKRFDFVFYTEADQILHLRTLQVMLPILPSNAEDPANHRSEGTPEPRPAILVPHRFHSVPTVADFRHVDEAFLEAAMMMGRDASSGQSEGGPQSALPAGDALFQVLGSANPARDLRALVKAQPTPPAGELPLMDTNWQQWFLPGASIRRERQLYERADRARLKGAAAGPQDSCCFLTEQQDGPRSPPQQGHASWVTPKYSPEKESARRPQVSNTDVFSIGNGFGMVAGDCCFICTFQNRYCHNTCKPKTGSDEGCALGSFHGQWRADGEV
eukprot:CAMPEP_0172595332 /NCGR_PEP_ID=MMETSP1068-20121228/14855_1 /TAXON_ID=35684 /ORGANISM="Pseudopedinella elastica, Strain CCMP716" /LENGTH=636 /DNA_ID=CAMNT_0013393789 /DNA_START=149 /DNA_END=2059 /DNA_ORIENTATION=+